MKFALTSIAAVLLTVIQATGAVPVGDDAMRRAIADETESMRQLMAPHFAERARGSRCEMASELGIDENEVPDELTECFARMGMVDEAKQWQKNFFNNDAEDIEEFKRENSIHSFEVHSLIMTGKGRPEVQHAISKEQDQKKSKGLMRMAFDTAVMSGNREVIAWLLQDEELDLVADDGEFGPLEIAWLAGSNLPTMELLMNDRRVISLYLNLMHEGDDDSDLDADDSDGEMLVGLFKHRPQYCLSVYAEQTCTKNGIPADSRECRDFIRSVSQPQTMYSTNGGNVNPISLWRAGRFGKALRTVDARWETRSQTADDNEEQTVVQENTEWRGMDRRELAAQAALRRFELSRTQE